MLHHLLGFLESKTADIQPIKMVPLSAAGRVHGNATLSEEVLKGLLIVFYTPGIALCSIGGQGSLADISPISQYIKLHRVIFVKNLAWLLALSSLIPYPVACQQKQVYHSLLGGLKAMYLCQWCKSELHSATLGVSSVAKNTNSRIMELEVVLA